MCRRTSLSRSSRLDVSLDQYPYSVSLLIDMCCMCDRLAEALLSLRQDLLWCVSLAFRLRRPGAPRCARLRRLLYAAGARIDAVLLGARGASRLATSAGAGFRQVDRLLIYE